MPEGVIKYFNTERGYGFIKRDDGKRDLFCHINQVSEDIDVLEVGQRVEFEEGISKNDRTQAVNVRFVAKAEAS